MVSWKSACKKGNIETSDTFNSARPNLVCWCWACVWFSVKISQWKNSTNQIWCSFLRPKHSERHKHLNKNTTFRRTKAHSNSWFFGVNEIQNAGTNQANTITTFRFVKQKKFDEYKKKPCKQTKYLSKTGDVDV